MDKTIKFLNDAKVFFVATINDNTPEVRPFGAINVYNNKLYIMTGAKKDVAKQIDANNNVAISAILNGNWIRIKTKLVKDESIEAKKSMLDNNPSLRGMYNELDPNMVIYYLSDATSTIYSFTNKPITEKF